MPLNLQRSISLNTQEFTLFDVQMFDLMIKRKLIWNLDERVVERVLPSIILIVIESKVAKKKSY